VSDTESKPGPLPWTGERFVPEVGGQIALEHLHRYALACELADGKAVLDIACGEGYGSAMLAERARSVVGVDRAVDVAAHAARRYGRSHVSFAAGACDNVPLATASFDLIVCFETIEHVGEHERVLAEFKRVLRPGGVLVLSSPEKSEYSDARQQTNPFHVKELYADEFRKLVQSEFRHVTVGGQRVVFGSAILMEGKGGPLRTYDWDGAGRVGADAMAKPQYLIAVASDAPLPAVGGGIFEQPINDTDIVQGWARAVAERDGRIAALGTQLAEREDTLAAGGQERDALRRRISTQDAQLMAASRALQEQLDQMRDLSKAVAERDAAMERMKTSIMWRLWAPFRMLESLFKKN